MSQVEIPNGSLAVTILRHEGESALVICDHPTDGRIARQIPKSSITPIGIDALMTAKQSVIEAGIPYGVDWKAAYLSLATQDPAKQAALFATAMAERGLFLLTDARQNMQAVWSALQQANGVMVADVLRHADSPAAAKKASGSK